MNPWWAFRMDPQGRPEWIFEKTNRERSQDLPTLYCPTGAIWIAKRNDLRTHGTFYMPNHTFYELPWVSSIDIDDKEDLEWLNISLVSLLEPVLFIWTCTFLCSYILLNSVHLYFSLDLSFCRSRLPSILRQY